MATQNLTVRSIQGLKPGRTRYEVFDALTPGLAIRVTPSGTSHGCSCTATTDASAG
jgi:hypothetical protein